MKLKGFKLKKDKGALIKHTEEPELNENYLSLIYDAISEVIFLLAVKPDDSFRFVSVNRAFMAVSGLTMEQVVGKRIEEVLPETAHALGKYKEAISEKKTVFWEQVFAYPTGELAGAVTVTPVLNAHGVCTHLVGSIHDITEHEQVDEALRESEEKFRILAENSIDCIWILDTRLKFTYLSPSVERMMGFKPEQWVGTKLSSHFKKKNFLKVGALIAKNIKNYETLTHVTFETKMLNSINDEVNVEISSKVLLNSQGKLIGFYGNTRDITDRKQAEKARHESEERFRTIVETAPSLLIITDTKGNNLYISPNCEEITGYTQEELLGELLLWVHEDDTLRAKELFERTFGEGLGYKNFEYKIVKKNGEVRYVSSSWDPLKVEDGKFNGIVFQTIDITERKQAEAELQKLNEELEVRVMERTNQLSESKQALENLVGDLNRTTNNLKSANVRLQELDHMKSMFIASTSHELRTPLNSIIGFSSVLIEGWMGEINPEQKEQLQLIHMAGEQLLALINDIIDISKIEAGKLETDIQEFRLKEVIDEAVSIVKNSIDEKELDLEVEVEDTAIVSDRRRLLQCLLNLLSNAVKFTEKGKITLHAKTINSMTNISITDTGTGIMPDDIKKLFAAFVRLESSLSAKTQGTGLGLYLTKKLTEDVLDGTIEVTSEYGIGSTFKLNIPVELEIRITEGE
ncbi:MAG: Signal transduction histidine kinase/PAS domain-containing protein/PAS domain-containing protein [Candidatus Methanocomedens sp.]|nr:MAG: Signal transduction histidine kinase/PAS domain-containing protein/PAS domain-containing protein [ANME-2 cluster archaeon]